MECPSCRAEVRDGSRFCDECGASVPLRCISCGGENRLGARFCSECGRELNTSDAPAPVPRSATGTNSAPTSSAERRQLTVLFCDLVGSTELSARLDPEDMQEVFAAYHRCVLEMVARFDGFIAKYMGDGVLAYFGWPRAHEDEAERAVRTGLAIVNAVAELETPARVPLAARVGIATGLVLVGELIGTGVAQEQTVIGETPNLAARLQALAAPGTVIISQVTRRLVGGLFELADLGSLRLKGFKKPVDGWRVVGEGRTEDRFEALHGERLTPLVGREHELGILLERWAWAKDGNGQVVLVAGEPGIGKSRMIRAVRECLGDEPCQSLSYYCSPYHTNSALHPVIGQLAQATRLDRNEPSEAQLIKLEAVLSRVSDRLNEVVPLLAPLLSIPIGERYLALTLTPEVQNRRTLQALVDQFVGLAAQQPVLAIYEDVHWIDPSTLELLGIVVERIQQLPVLVLVTFRPEFQPPWTRQAHVTALTLSRLGWRHGSDLVTQITRDKPLPSHIIEQIVARADGVPLFVEELTSTVLERAPTAITADAIPETLRDSLMERLDRLPLGPTVVQTASVIGRSFDFEDLQGLLQTAPEDLARTLDSAVNAGLLSQRGFPPRANYVFKHFLIRDTAYETLLIRRRRELHRTVAEKLEQRSEKSCPPELIAQHFAAAEMPDRAFPLFLRAGREAHAVGALKESVAHFEAAEAELNKLRAGEPRDQAELQLQIARGAVLLASKGYGAPEVRKAYERARELSDSVQDDRAAYATLWGLSSYFAVAGPSDLARDIADRTISTAVRVGDPFLHAEACRRRGLIAFVVGEFRDAECFYAAAIELLGKVPDPDAVLFGTRPYSLLWNNTAWLSWFIGSPAEAIEQARSAVDHARGLGDPYALVFALGVAAAVAQHSRNAELTWDFASECVGLSERQRFSYWGAWGKIFGGWADVVSGQSFGVDRIRLGLDEYRATGAAQLELCARTLLADALMHLNELESAEAVINELDPPKPGGGLYFLAEMWRVAAEISLRRNGQAEQTLKRICSAIDTARLQGAKTLELRARAWKVAHLGPDSEEELKAELELAATVALNQGYDRELFSRALGRLA